MKYQVVMVDAWADEGGWTWNNSHFLFSFSSKAIDIKRVFLRKLRKFLNDGVQTISGIREHIDLGKGWFYVGDYGDVLELRNRKDHCPCYACIHEMV